MKPTAIEVIVCALILLILTGLVGFSCHRERVVMPESYRAWVKHTGNPNNLNFKEWRALIRADEGRVIFMPVTH